MNTTIVSGITDKAGFTWFSTLTGLQRFNGYELQTIDPVADSDTIKINYPVFFLKNSDHSFLIGYKKGILEFNADDNSFKKLVSINPTTALNYSVIPITTNKKETWYMKENKGIMIYNDACKSTTILSSFNSATADSVFLANDLIQNNKIIAANDDYIFIRISEQRIIQVNIKTHAQGNLDFPGKFICSVTCNKDNIFISFKDGLTSIRISNNQPIHNFLFRQIAYEAINFSGIELKGENHLLVSLGNRLFEFDTSCVCQKELTNLNNEPFVSTGDIPFIYEDRFRRIWILSLNEIKRIQDIDIPFEHYLYPKEKNNFIRSFYVDDKQKLLLAGCFNGGIQLYDLSGKPLWEKSLIIPEVKNVIGIEKLSPGHYLIMTLTKGLYLLDIAKRELQPIIINGVSSPGLNMHENAYSNSLKRIDDSTIFISTRSNVFRCIFKNNKLTSSIALFPKAQVTNHPVSCFMIASNNTLWVGTESGIIFTIDAKGSSKTLAIPDNYFVKCMSEDSLQQVWIGTAKGIFIFSPSGNLVKKISNESGLLNDFIYALLPADKSSNNFFASTNLGLSYIAQDGKINNYTKELGLQENEFNTQSCAKESTGKLLFGGINGITAFNPSRLSIPNDTPIITITRLVVNDSLYNYFGGPWLGNSLSLPYDHNRFLIDIAALGILNPNEYTFKYRMKSYEKSWQSISQPRGIRYSLPPGNYSFEIMCSPVLSSNTVFYKKIAITINPAWWQTWWFRIIAILLSVILIALVVLRYYQQKYQKKIRHLQLQNEIKTERERISKELHDNIGTQLSYISSNMDWMLYPPVTLTKLEETQRLSAVNNTAKEVIADLRETIWAMKKESVHLDELADRLKLLLQSQHLVKPGMDIKINEKINTNTIFSPTEALNIFRISQEAIVNSVKHAEAGMLTLSIQSGANVSYSISVEDNGKGYWSIEKFPGHYGQENMRSRAQELKATLTIISEVGKGTKVTLTKNK